MSTIFKNKYFRQLLVATYVLLQGFFLGLGLIWSLPNVLSLQWPYSLIPGYALGFIGSIFITYIILKKWDARLKKKIILALICLCLALLLGYSLAAWGTYSLKLRVIEEMGTI